MIGKAAGRPTGRPAALPIMPEPPSILSLNLRHQLLEQRVFLLW